MWLRRAYYGWLIPAAFLLPLWLVVASAFSNPGGWAFLWMLLVAVPSVAVGQLGLTLLVRARTVARAQRAVSWWDVVGFTLWHCLTVALGFFGQPWWAAVFVSTVCVGLGVFWLEVWQLWRQATTSRTILHAVTGVAALAPRRSRSHAPDGVYVMAERESVGR